MPVHFILSFKTQQQYPSWNTLHGAGRTERFGYCTDVAGLLPGLIRGSKRQNTLASGALLVTNGVSNRALQALDQLSWDGSWPLYFIQ